jgi:hypothetical protein
VAIVASFSLLLFLLLLLYLVLCTQVFGIQPLGVLQRLPVPASPVSALIARDEKDRLPPRIEREQDPHLCGLSQVKRTLDVKQTL